MTISGGGLSRVFQVDASVTASISGLTITGGNAAGSGGGLYNDGTITLTNCTVSGNSASYGGGGVSNYGTLDADQLHRQRQLRQPIGGGVFMEPTTGGTATLTNCTVSGNSADSSAAAVQLRHAPR